MPDYSDGVIDVHYAHALNDAQNLLDQNTAVKRTLESLEAELNVLQQTWFGADRDMYQQKKQAWNERMTALSTCLAESSTLLDGIVREYQRKDARLTDGWQSVRI